MAHVQYGQEKYQSFDQQLAKLRQQIEIFEKHFSPDAKVRFTLKVEAQGSSIPPHTSPKTAESDSKGKTTKPREGKHLNGPAESANDLHGKAIKVKSISSALRLLNT